MCYKDEVQRKNAEKLQRKLDEYNVSDLIRRYFINMKSWASALNFWSAIKNFLLWMIEHNKIKKESIADIELCDFYEIEPEDITLYLRDKEADGISPTTLQTRKNILKSFWEYLIRQKKSEIRDDFFKDVSYSGVYSNNNLIRKLPSDEQIEKMEEKIKKKKDEFVRFRNLVILDVLKGTGLREAELAGLDMSDIHLGEEMPYVVVLGKGKYYTQQSRIVYLTGSATKSMEEWLLFRKKMKNVVDTEAVFINKNGKRFTEGNIQSMFKTYGNGITPHMLRHWYATVISNKGNLVFAQQQLGHSSYITTTNNYVNGAYGMKDTLKNM